MKRQFTNSILILILLTFAKTEVTLLEPKQATEHFLESVKNLITEKLQYEIKDEKKDTQESFSMAIYNGQTFAATVGMSFEKAYKNYSHQKAKFVIQGGAKNPTISKYIMQYYQEEIDMQIDVVQELILQQGELHLNDKNQLAHIPIFLHLIPDIRISIIENNPTLGIVFDLDIEENEETGSVQEVMIMKSREASLAKIQVSISSQEGKQSHTGRQQTDFKMNVIVSKLGSQENPLQVEIPMVTTNVNEFKQKMLEIHNYLKLDQQSNNLKEHYLNLVGYLSVKFNGFVSQLKTDIDKFWNKAEFHLKFNDKQVEGKLESLENGYYKLSLFQNNKLYKEIEFLRMNVQDLHDLFATQKIHTLFQNINENVLEIFEDKHREIILKELPNWVLQKYEIQRGYIGSFIFRDYHGYQNNNKFLFTCDNHTNKNKVEIVYSGQNMSNLKFSHTFPAERFDYDTTADYIEYILQTHVDLMKENGLLDVPYMI